MANQWTGPEPLEPRLWARIDASGDCWLWTGGGNDTGYGTIGVNGANRYAHRVVYEVLVGPIAAGLQVDHLCRVLRCVNPDHLELVTPAENTRRGYSVTGLSRRENRCQRGHRFESSNTYVVAATGARRCRECVRARQRRDYHAKKEAA